ncbi:hypothetical protein U1Q18_049474, partial [Sarracenia purpurea var. burkii]
ESPNPVVQFSIKINSLNSLSNVKPPSIPGDAQKGYVLSGGLGFLAKGYVLSRRDHVRLPGYVSLSSSHVLIH